MASGRFSKLPCLLEEIGWARYMKGMCGAWGISGVGSG